ncbi:MAG: lectin like domain-containing protein, partial [Methanoregula sp.]|nr:lectin like domain-containing protein [Methanoregula sp.]
MQNIYFLPARASSTANDNIKNALTNWGAVKASIYWDDLYFNETNDAFYNGISTSTNHAITIIGWDDTYPASNFNTAPAGPGAFIVKNSWGSGWGNAGYFYISYYDLQIGNRCVVFMGEPITNFNRVYSYDPLGWVRDYGYSPSTSARFANIYTSQSAETLKAVGFYTTDSNAAYVVTIYRSPDSGPIYTGGSAATTSGTLGSPGYHTVTVPDVALTAGQKYSIVVSVTNPTYAFPVAIEAPDPGYASPIAHGGESYTSSDGVTWNDLTTEISNANVCLKGYTIITLPTIDTVSPVSANLNRTIYFTVTGTKFETGDGQTWVNFTRGVGVGMFDNINITLNSVTAGGINGTMVIGDDAPPGKWNLTVTTVNSGTSLVKINAITVSQLPVPSNLVISPTTSWLQNTSVDFTITGSTFMPGQTKVYLINQTTGELLNTTVLTGITTTRINGTIFVPYNAPIGNMWNVNISTIDSRGNGTLSKAFTIAKVLLPTITSITPTVGSKNTTVNFTIVGT